MLPTDWASAARSAKYQQSPEHQQAINILESMLLAKESPSNAANAIAATYERQITERHGHRYVGVFWSILSDAVRVCGATDGQADKLVGLIIAMQGLPDVTDSLGVPIKHEYAGVFWRDLPGWHMMFREYGIDVEEPEDYESGERLWREQREPLLNATTFAAILLARAPFTTGMVFHACTAFWCALDHTEGNTEEHQRAEMYMPAAATWILKAGQKLHEACNGRLDLNHVYSLFPERWDQWKARFQAISIDQAFDQDSRDWAARAASQM